MQDEETSEEAAVEATNSERSIDSLDYTDRRLFQACTNNNVAFIWPNSTSGRSVDEERTQREERRLLVRSALSNARSHARSARGSIG